jgi:hypothetical protein
MVSVCRQCCWERCRQHRNSFHLSTVCSVAHWRFLDFVLTLGTKRIKVTKIGCYCSPVINILFIKAVKYFPGDTVENFCKVKLLEWICPSTDYVFYVHRSCILIFLIYSYSKTNKMHQFLKLFILVKHTTCFGRSFLPSSGVQDCTYSNRLLPAANSSR